MNAQSKPASSNTCPPGLDTAKVYELSGTLRSIVYQTPAGFCIFKFENETNNKVSTCIGVLKEVHVGGAYKIKGTAAWSDKYSEIQLKVTEVTFVSEWTNRGVETYLATECKHLGPAYAKMIAEAFGTDWMRIIEERPEKLCELIPKFTLEKAKAVSEWVMEERKFRAAKQELYNAGMTYGLIKKVIDEYGSMAVVAVKEHCFELVDISGIGFLTVSKIADNLGIPLTDPNRIKHGIAYTMEQLMQSGGHTCILDEDLIRECCRLIGVNKDSVIEQLKKLSDDGELCTTESDPSVYTDNINLFVRQLQPKENGVNNGNKQQQNKEEPKLSYRLDLLPGQNTVDAILNRPQEGSSVRISDNDPVAAGNSARSIGGTDVTKNIDGQKYGVSDNDVAADGLCKECEEENDKEECEEDINPLAFPESFDDFKF